MTMQMQQESLRHAGLTISSKAAHELLQKGSLLIRLTTDGGLTDWDAVWVVDLEEPSPKVFVDDSGEVVLIPSGGYLIEDSFNADFNPHAYGYDTRDDLRHLHFGMD